MVDYKQKLGIKTWAEADRPREKLLVKGSRQLTDAELLAILISSGNKLETAVDLSKRMLGFYQNDLSKLAKLTVKELCKFKGIGQVKALSIVAALELGRRRKELADEKKIKITSAAAAFSVIQSELSDITHEEFWIILLNRANAVTGKHLISSGGLSATVVDPKIVFRIALEQNAAGLILAHNHPSGNLVPSESDRLLTEKIVSAGRFLEIRILDHLIVCGRTFYSFADEGLIESEI